MRLLDLRLTGLIFVAGVLACSTTQTGEDDPQTTGQGSGTDSASSTSAGTTASSVTTSATGTASASASDSGGSTGSATTGPSGTSSGSSSGGTSVGTTDATGTTGGPAGGECVTDKDCKLINDCCSCEAAPLDEDEGPCENNCFQPLCDAMGIGSAVCRFGTCKLEEHNCNQTEVVCLAPTPNCEEGFLPEVENGCWTGICLPKDACNWVPDCSYCEDTEFCATKVTQLGEQRKCEPVPPDCDGVATCECAAMACEAPFDTCNDAGGDLSCSCPVCG